MSCPNCEKSEAALAEMKASRDHWKSSAEQHCKSATDWHAKLKEATASREAEQRVIDDIRQMVSGPARGHYSAETAFRALEEIAAKIAALTAPAQKPEPCKCGHSREMHVEDAGYCLFGHNCRCEKFTEPKPEGGAR
jgi:hypothetical protein